MLIVLVVFCVNTYSMQMKEINRTLQAPLTSGDYDEGQFGFLTSVVALADADGNVKQLYTRGATLGGSELKFAVKESLSEDISFRRKCGGGFCGCFPYAFCNA